jgi:hypothetical protein
VISTVRELVYRANFLPLEPNKVDGRWGDLTRLIVGVKSWLATKNIIKGKASYSEVLSVSKPMGCGARNQKKCMRMVGADDLL